MTTPLVSPWTPESEERLRAMAAEGKMSRYEMAMELGVTRSACIGKMNRMGLAGPPRPPRLKSAHQLRMPAAAPKAAKSPPAPRPEPPVSMAVPLSQRGRVKFMDLTDKTCRWPLFASDEAFHMKHYCGRVPVAGSPYCKAHRSLAYHVARS
jgi:hypothetical protein